MSRLTPEADETECGQPAHIGTHHVTPSPACFSARRSLGACFSRPAVGRAEWTRVDAFQVARGCLASLQKPKGRNEAGRRTPARSTSSQLTACFSDRRAAVQRGLASTPSPVSVTGGCRRGGQLWCPAAVSHAAPHHDSARSTGRRDGMRRSGAHEYARHLTVSGLASATGGDCTTWTHVDAFAMLLPVSATGQASRRGCQPWCPAAVSHTTSHLASPRSTGRRTECDQAAHTSTHHITPPLDSPRLTSARPALSVTPRFPRPPRPPPCQRHTACPPRPPPPPTPRAPPHTHPAPQPHPRPTATP